MLTLRLTGLRDSLCALICDCFCVRVSFCVTDFSTMRRDGHASSWLRYRRRTWAAIRFRLQFKKHWSIYSLLILIHTIVYYLFWTVKGMTAFVRGINNVNVKHLLLRGFRVCSLTARAFPWCHIDSIEVTAENRVLSALSLCQLPQGTDLE